MRIKEKMLTNKNYTIHSQNKCKQTRTIIKSGINNYKKPNMMESSALNDFL